MKTAAQILADSHRAAAAPERLCYGKVELQVTDLDRAVDFWTTALGLEVRHETERAELGTAAETFVVLRAGATRAKVARRSGLYHVAIGMPSQPEFSRMLARMMTRRIAVSPVDHVMSKALYLDDPDGLGIEITLETPERFGRFDESRGGIGLIDSDGRKRSVSEPLDVAAELIHARNENPDAPIAAGAHIAHLHFHVPDLERAVQFYERLGLVPNLVLPELGFADLGAGGDYTHRLAVNVWQGRGAAPAPQNSARLLHYVLHLADAAAFARMREQDGTTTLSDGSLRLSDPAGVTLTVTLDS